MRAYDSAMRTTASSWRTVIGTTGVSLSFSLAAARACRPHPPELSIQEMQLPNTYKYPRTCPGMGVGVADVQAQTWQHADLGFLSRLLWLKGLKLLPITNS